MAPEIVYDVLGVKSDDLAVEVIRQFVAPDPLFFSVDNRPINDLAQRDVDIVGFIDTELRPVIHIPVANLAALKAIVAADRFDNQVAHVDSPNEWWKFDASSTATNDDVRVAQPTAGTGRWLRLADETHLTVHRAVADLTALAAIPAVDEVDNQIIHVDSEQVNYKLDTGSAATADGKHIVTATGGGRWFRLHGDGTVAPAGTVHHDTASLIHGQAVAADWITTATGDSVKDHLDELATRGVFVAKIGGTSPDYAGTAIRTALSDFQNSSREFALFIVREDMVFSGGALTVDKPFKMVGQSAGEYDLSFNGSDVLTIDTEATTGPGFAEAEFVHINIDRGAAGTGGILFPKDSSLRMRFGKITDAATGPTVDFIRFTADGIIELEATSLVAIANQSLISGVTLTVTCRRCNIADTVGETFSATTLELYLLEGTTFLTDDFTSVTTLRVWLDGTSILSGDTQIPTGFTNLEVSGRDFWTPQFAVLGLSFSDAVNFNISSHLELANAVISLGSTVITVSRSDLKISGSGRGSDGTRIEGSPSATGNNVITLTGSRIRIEGIVFRSSPSVASHTGAVISGTLDGLEVVDCEFQAEGSNDTGGAILLGSSGAFARDRNLVRNCWVRSSPDGTPAVWRGTAVVVNGSGLIENAMVEDFEVNGISATSTNNPIHTGGRVSNCVVDMSGIISGAAVGIGAQGVLLTNCRVRCPGLGTNQDTAIAIKVTNAGGVTTGEGAVVSNCQISGEGTSSARRIGIGISIPSGSDQCKISGCSIKDFRKQGILIAGALNIVVHNIISSINDGTDSPAIETIVTTGLNNLIDANLETTTSGYVNGGGATNHFDVANTDNTGNKTV